MRGTRAPAAALAVVALALLTPTAASAAPGSLQVHGWSTDVVMPFSLAVDGQQRVLVADGATGSISRLQPSGHLAPVVEGVTGLAGLALRGAWMAYGTSVAIENTEPPVIIESGLVVRAPNGNSVYADTHAFETAENPDGDVTYGPVAPSCLEGMEYQGLIDSHVYAVAAWRGQWLVADAGANALFAVTDRGEIRTVAVLPPVEVTITDAMVAQYDLPPCAAGTVYRAEAVPTGVAVGPGGQIYVSTLPGVPGEAAGAGAVWRVDPDSGALTLVATGLRGATSVAVSGANIYVAELFGPGVAVIRDGDVAMLAEVPGTLSVATSPNGTVWASTMASETAPGTIVSIAKGKAKLQGTLEP